MKLHLIIHDLNKKKKIITKVSFFKKENADNMVTERKADRIMVK